MHLFKMMNFSFFVGHILGTLHINFFFEITIEKDGLSIDYFSQVTKCSTIKSNTQKSYAIPYWRIILQQMNTRYLTIPTCNKMHPVTPLCLILKTHLFFMHLQLGGIRLLLVMCQTCCLFMLANFFLIASCYFIKEFMLRWFQASLKFLGSSGAGFNEKI